MSENVAAKGRLENLPSTPRLTGREAAAHTRMVRRLRIALPVIGAILIGVFLANTRNGREEDVFLDQFKTLEAATEELRMAKPHFSGVDADGRPFDITADAATQSAGDDRRVGLEGPRAVSGPGGEEQAVLSADKGEFDSDTKTLVLREDVVFERRIGADNYVLRTPSATFLIEDDQVVSDAGVEGEGPRGSRLRADRMTASNESRRAVFEGNVAVRIYPSREKGACVPSLTPGGAAKQPTDCVPDASETGTQDDDPAIDGPTIREER